jgi:CPA1 family monovalent cation:H+ antiporter
VRWLGLGHVGRREAASNRRAENAARVEGIDAVLATLNQWEQDTDLPRSAIQALKRFHAERKSNFSSEADVATGGVHAKDVAALRLELIGVERDAISAAYEQNRLTDEARRRSERELDLEEASIRHGAGDDFD